MVNVEAIATTAQKNQKISIEILKKVEAEHLWEIMIKLLRIYLIFAMNIPDFFVTTLQEIVIFKNNSIYAVLDLNLNVSIFSTKD